jgi:hypothetical protein
LEQRIKQGRKGARPSAGRRFFGKKFFAAAAAFFDFLT